MKTKRHPAFTLVELMISIALALILILGINQVFALTAKTVGAGNALGSAYQADRNTQVIMANDFKNMVNTAPLIITSQWMSAFRSLQDFQNNVDGNPLHVQSLGGNSITISNNVLHPRNHRVDTIGFFSRDLYQRQTGSGGAMLSPGSSYEAYIWYGHCATSSATGTGNMPGQGAGNLYANQWWLGRMAMLFQQNATSGTAGGLMYGSSSSSGYSLQSSRYDVISGSIDAFTAQTALNLNGWWQPGQLNFRFQASPQPAEPLTADAAAYTVPAFVPGCSQFCVEFAGDYVNQTATGAQNRAVGAIAGPDGTIDFNVVNGVHEIRWYGMSRSVVGDGQAVAPTGSGIGSRGDVVPVSSDPGLPNGTKGSGPAYTFEKVNNGISYTAAWSPAEPWNPRPKLIRITWAVEDPNNRLGEPVTFEYIYPVP